MIVEARRYCEGRRVADHDSIEALGADRSPGGFSWLGLRMPDETELRCAQAAFGLPELAVIDALQTHDRPKVERHDGCLFVVVPTARYVESREVVEFGELFIFIGVDFAVTVRYGQAAPLAGVRAELEATPELLRWGPGAVLQAALAHVVDSYRPVVAGLENDIREVERDVFSGSRSQPTRRIYFLIREVLDFLMVLEPLSTAVNRLVSDEYRALIPGDLRPLFDDIHEAVADVLADTRAAHSLLDNALIASTTQVSLMQNEDTRKISAWAAIGVLPTVVAGLFGMNLDGIPFADHIAGFGVVTGLSLLCSYGLYRKFRASGWL
ncbi:MAG: magnesium and cobalt transport protein CorA [Ilumatobacteraceae bacterium]|nr:magnesium and cobalt transport protein CorA [Ilumatobacteraceae bacterium]